jgi:arylesterase/paraoxonase
MKRWQRLILFSLIIVVLLVLRTLHYAGAFKRLQSIGNFKENILSGMIGAEDITIDFSAGIALVSSDDRRRTLSGSPVKGDIFLLNLRDKNPVPLSLKHQIELSEFHPHGISLYTNLADSTKWLFVVNHKKNTNAIEIFEFRDSLLIHNQSIENEFIISPNDIVGTGKNTFYFTNDHDTKGGVSSWKDFLVIGTGQLGYFDGKKAKILATGIRYANGVTISPDGKKVYVAACTDGSILSYNREPFSAIGKIKCNTGVDNLEWDEEGNLWVGAHSKMLAFLSHAKNEINRSPSEVLKISFPKNQAAKVEQIYLNDGNPLSGSSVAAPYNGKIYVGGVFDDGVLVLKP